jgi:hypothetical protein
MRRLNGFVAPVFALSLVAAACANGDDDNEDVDAAPTTDAAVGTPDAPEDTPDAADPIDAAAPVDADNSPSGQIATARAAADGAVDLPIAAVFVTYLKPAVGTDLPGFFVQAEQDGPALFIAVDPASLSPVPAVGDEVSFDITAMATAAMLRQATAIDAFAVASSGNDVSGLVQNVTAATDLVTAVGDYESELVTADTTIVADFASAGTGHVQAQVDTTGITGDTNLRLRVPSGIVDQLGLENGCTVTVTATPMWRFNTSAQISAYDAAELTAACQAPAVLSAVAPSLTEVVVVFSRPLDTVSVLADGTQFTITGGAGLTVISASASGDRATLVTSAQTPATTYTVTVAATVTDVLGAGVDAGANSATFDAFTPPPSVALINEVDYDQIGTDNAEFIELYNPGISPVDLTNVSVMLVNGADDDEYMTVALSGTLAPGGYAVIAPAGFTVPGGVLKFDFPGATNQVQNGAPDGIAVVDTSTLTVIDALSYEGSITAATLPDFPAPVNLVEGTATTAVDNGADGSLSRSPNGSDTDDAATDWTFLATPTPGAANE